MAPLESGRAMSGNLFPTTRSDRICCMCPSSQEGGYRCADHTNWMVTCLHSRSPTCLESLDARVEEAEVRRRVSPMKAVRIHQHGGPEAMQVDELPPPTPSEGQVLIRVEA